MKLRNSLKAQVACATILVTGEHNNLFAGWLSYAIALLPAFVLCWVSKELLTLLPDYICIKQA